MARVLVNCVPDDDPNADGVWLNRRVPAWVLAPGLRGRFNLLTEHCAPKGTHVVNYRGTRRGKRTYVDPLGGLHYAVHHRREMTRAQYANALVAIHAGL